MNPKMLIGKKEFKGMFWKNEFNFSNGVQNFNVLVGMRFMSCVAVKIAFPYNFFGASR